jgi:hypothetical protein
MQEDNDTSKESLMGLHFDPDGKGSGGYVITSTYWNELEECYGAASEDGPVRYLIEAGFHYIGEIEHHSGWSNNPQEAFEIVALKNSLLHFVRETILVDQFESQELRNLADEIRIL